MQIFKSKKNIEDLHTTIAKKAQQSRELEITTSERKALISIV
jgi:hypothetical protein